MQPQCPAWEDGDIYPSRHLCLSSPTSLSVSGVELHELDGA